MIGKFLLDIFIAFVALFVCGILLLIILHDIKYTILYLTAKKANGLVLEYLGEKKTANYGRYQMPTVYNKFRVSYFADGQDRFGEFLTKDKRINIGMSVEVHYIINKDKTVEVINRDIPDRFLRLGVAAIITPLIILALYLFTKSDLPEKMTEMSHSFWDNVDSIRYIIR